MPPITDPNMLAAIKAQQSGVGQAPQTLGGPAPSLNIGPIVPSNIASVPNTQADTRKTNALLPGQITEQNARTARELLALRKERQAQGLDPDTGKPMFANNGPTGPDALKNLSPADHAKVLGILTGKWTPSAYQQTRDPDTKRLISIAFAAEPGLDLTKLQQRGPAYQKFFGNPKSPVINLNQAMSHLDLWYKRAQALNNSHQSAVPFKSLIENVAHQNTMASQQDPRLTDLAEATNHLGPELSNLFRGSGGAAEADINRQIENLKNPHLTPEGYAHVAHTIAQYIGSRQEALQNQAEQSLGPYAQVMTPEAKQLYEKYSDPNFIAPVPKQDIAVSTTDQAKAIPPELQQANADFLKNTGKGNLTPEAYIKFRQEQDAKFGGQSQLDPKAVKDFVDGFNQTGNLQAIPAGSAPLHGLGKAMADFSAGPVGDFLENAANAGTLGAVHLAAGEDARDAQAINDKNHPVMSTLGDMAGSFAPIMGLTGVGKGLVEKLAPKLSGTARAALLGDTAGNAAYGTARGFNDADNGQGVTGAFEGLGAGALGGAAGEVIGKGVPALFNPVTEKAMAMLKGVDLTTLQRLGLGRVENGLRSLPFVRGGTAKAMDSMNTDRANNLLSLLPEGEGGQGFQLRDGLSPQERNDGIYNAADISYDALKPQIVGSRTGDFENTIAALGTDAKKTAFGKDNFGDIQEAIDRAFDENGHFDGEGYKSAMMRLRSLKQGYLNYADKQGSTHAQDLASTAEAAAGTLKGLVKSQVPEDVANGIDNTDKVWAGMQPIFDATNRATASNGGIYSPGQAFTSLKGMDLSNNNQLFARGKMPGQDYLQAAQHVMGSGAIPESVGGWGAAEGGGGLAAAATVGLGTPVGLSLSGLYAPVLKRAIQKITTARPDFMTNGSFAGNATIAATADAIRKMMTGN